MSCILRVAGENFDADAFITASGLLPHTVWYKGQPRSKSGKELNQKNGFNLTVSNAPFGDFKSQATDALDFLAQNTGKLQLLNTFDVEFATLDFGVETTDNNGMYKGFYFPPALIEAASSLNLGIETTVYLSSNDE